MMGTIERLFFGNHSKKKPGAIVAESVASKNNDRAPRRGRIYGSITETIGDTPIVPLGKLAAEKGVKANLLAKLEFFNPSPA
jgi:hypothetical protein